MGAHLFGWRDTSSRSRKSCLSLDTWWPHDWSLWAFHHMKNE
jgi:hypothetical protein